MLIREFRISNHKSIVDSGQIHFGSGINVVVGENSSGKSALLETLSLRFRTKPHLSEKTSPRRGANLEQSSKGEIAVEISGEDIKHFIARTNQVIDIPIPAFLSGKDKAEIKREIEEKLFTRTLSFRYALTSDTSRDSTTLNPIGNVSGLPWNNPNYIAKVRSVPSAGDFVVEECSPSGNNPLVNIIAHSISDRIYAFKAERLGVGTHAFGTSANLASNASNLPEVLNTLSSFNPARYERYLELVRRIFPRLLNVRAVPIHNNQLQIRLWYHDPKTERDDLSVALTEAGTGVAQVLSILYVLVTSDAPQIFIVDEPNSFLHPGAVKRLVELFIENSKHQFILSTHSCEVISASRPSSTLMVTIDGLVSNFHSMDLASVEDSRRILRTLGAELSDVFGSDSVLWVEGATEQICFPKIITAFGLTSPGRDIRVIAVRSTGEFSKENLMLVLSLYRKVSGGNALVPPAIGFVLDRDDRTEGEMVDIVRASKNLVSFLERRCFENYLLNPRALAKCLNLLPTFENSSVVEDQVRNWIETNRANKKYMGRTKTSYEFKDLDAPKLLADLFSDLSECKEKFDKTMHVPLIVDAILESSPEDLSEIAEMLKLKIEMFRTGSPS